MDVTRTPKQGSEKQASGLAQLFFGRLASFFRERSRRRRQFGHRRAIGASRQMRLEPLEARLLLSADVSLLLPQASEEIVFVDSRVVDAASLVGQLDAEVVLLDPDANGVQRIAEVLSQREGLSAVHVISHGVAGRVTLGSAGLDAQSLEIHAEALRTWGSALDEGGDLFFYGCSIAEGDEGVALVDGIAVLTGADVAASTDMTGAAALGGDWDLEYRTGLIETAYDLSAGGYQFLLAPTLDGVSAIADSGSPRDELLASANVSQAVLLTGTGFSLSSQVVFPTINYLGTVGTQAVKAVQAAADGSSIIVVVPDTARTGNLTVVGGSGSAFLQIVPTIVDVDLTGASFGAGANFQILGSGFIEGDVTIRFGATPVVDTGISTGPDVSYYSTIGAGLDRADNEAIFLQVPAGAASGPITVETAGGTSAALPITLSQVQGLAMSGIPANPAQASANPGQTVRILGQALDYSTEVIFPIIDVNGAFSNRAVLPDFVNADRTLMEVRVPLDALTGNVQVVGAAGSFALQVVPVLALAEVWPGVPQLRLLGGGFSEGATLTVNVNGTPIADTGANLDVSSSFIANDRLHVSTAASAGQVVSVSTAGGTSAAVTIALDDPATVGAMYDLAIFPPTAGADAGRLVVADGSSTLKVLDPLTLAVVRTLTLPGAATTQLGVAFIGADVTVGGVLVPAGSLAVVNGADTPDRLYYLDPVSGAVLASVALGGPHPTDEAGGFALAYHAARGTLFVMRNNTDLITEINPASGAALRSFHTNFGVADYYAALTVHPVRGTLLAGNGARVFELDAASGEVVGSYDHIGNTQLGPVDVRQQGATFEDSQRYLTGLAFDGGGNLRASTYSSGRILDLTLPGAPTAIQVGAALAVAIDGTPADPALPSANAGQRILISGSGYNRFTEVEFERVTESGARGYLRVAADAVRADGSALEVVVPEEAVTGRVRISGAPGAGLRLQVTPTIRATLPADPSINFDVPVEGDRWGLFGSGLVEGATTVSFGGVLIEDNSASALVDVLDVSATGFFRDNGRLDLTIPERSLAGPVTVTTEGGTFTQPGVPIRSQAGVGLTGLVATAGQGTATNALAASANTGQTISLQGFGLTTGSLVSFQGVAEDGTRGLIVTRPVTAVPDGTSATVVVPVLAVSGPVTVAGAAGAFTLQIVPTLTGVSAGSLTPGAPLWLIGTGIPEGGAGGGEAVTYTVGGVAVSDIDGTLGPDVRSALGKALAVALNTPAGASGDTITVSTAGGSATLTLVNLSTGSLAAEPQGSGAADGVGGTLASATALNVGPNSSLTVTGRTNTAPDVDLYRLDGAEAGGILSVTAAGPQPGYSIVRIFNASGNPIASGNDTSVSRIVLPAGGPYYLGYSGYPNQSYNSVDGTGMQNGIFFPGDYTLALRYADPGTTSLDAIGTVAASGVPTEALVASANVGQAISVQGAGFTSATRVVFTTFSGYSPYSGPLEREVAPASVAPGGTSLTVVVPHDAVTGVVRLADERAGLLLQIVPTLGDIDLTSGVYSDTASLTLSGSGFVEGAQTLLLGNAIGAGGAAEVQDLWVGAGPDVYYSFVGGPFTDNSVTSLTVPIEPPTGPLKVRTLGGTSAPYELQFTGIAPGTVADRGTPANGLLASANVREAITLLGAGFDSGTEVIFAIQTSNDDQRGTRVLTPTSVAADGTSLTLIVPDDAVTGELRVMGAEGSHFLQIVPTIVQVLTPGTFATGQSMTVQGSGFIEGDVSIVLGGTVLFDTGAFFGPDVHNSSSIGAGLDRFDNDGLSFTLPPGAGTSVIVRTSGGEATLISISGIEAIALSGTPANAAVASANAGQTIRLVGDGITLSTQIIFPIIDVNGALSNRVVRPDLASVDGSLGEVRVPNDALTGNVQVVGAAGSFALQVVPVLALAEVWPGVPQLRLLGGGFTEGATLTVNVNGTPIADTGANLDVSSSFIANDRLHVSTAASAGQVVSVSTAGGTSAAVTIALDDPATVGAMYDLAIFPPTAGADAGRLVVADGSSTLKVLDPLTLAVVRTLTLPGAATTQLGVAFIGADVTVGGVLVPAGSLAVVNGADTPDRLYYLDPVSGAVLASVALGGPHPTDEAGGFALAYHAARGTLFVMRNNTDLITEINPASGAALRSFHTNFGVADYYAALTVHPVRGTLLAGNGARVFELDAASGEVVGSYDHIGNTQLGPVDVRQQGATFEDSQRYLTGLAFDGGGNLRASTYSSGRILDLTLPGAPTAIQVGAALAVAIDGTPADPALPSANAGQRILISGSGYNRFTEVEFERVTESGARGYLRVAADAVRADGSALEVVVPEEAVTGRVRISGAPGAGLRLQVTPTIRATLPADPSINFDVPVEGDRWGLFGSGLVEGATTVSFGGVLIEDNSASALVDVLDVSATGFFRDNGRLDLTIPERSLAGPVTVTTEGGTFTQPGVPIRSQAGVGLTGLVATAGQGTATNALAASANTGQTISLQGFGLTTGSLVSFQGVAEDGTRGLIVTRPVTAVPDGTSATVVVPVLAVSGPVTVAGAAGAFTLQIVPTLTGVSAGSLTPGAPLWLIGTGIPEGGAGGGEAVTYTVGGVAVSDIDGTLGPDVRSALGKALAVALNTPAGASGDTITVSTAGGSATLTLVNLSTGSLAAEPQGSGAADGVGGTLASATALNVGPNSSLTVTGRTNTAPDVDLYRLDGAEAGGILSVTAAGPQPGYSIVRIFNASGNPIASGNDTSVSRIVLPAGGPYYLGYSGYPNQSYNSVDGTGMQNGIFFPGDYTLALRYADPGTTSLDAIGTVAASGVPTEALVASANVGQAISVQGAGFTSATRVVFTTFSGYSPYSGPLEREVAPASVAPGGTSLTVVVPHDAVTGVVRLADERAGLLLQIVPTLGDIDLTSGVYSDTASLTLSGSGFVEGAQTLLLGNAIGAGGAAEVQDLWVGAGPDVYYSFVGGPFTDNSVTSLTVPIEPPTGPLKVRTLGGTSAPYELQFTGIAPGTVADRGTPANGLLASANVREAITLLGAGFDSGTEVIFAIQTSNDDQRGTRVLTPTSVAADGTSLTLIVPDDAVTGELRVMGAEGSHFLQIVPTIVQVLTPGTFATGQSMTVQGSGFIEGDVSIVLGGTVLFDTGAFFGPDVHNSSSIGAGLDRFDNDGLSFTLPPGASANDIRVRTSGGEAAFVVTAHIESTALSGTPANAAVASANAGQTIRLVGDGITLSTQIIFPIIDVNGALSNRVVRPDLASVDGSLGEVRVPNDALTGNVQVVGAAGSFALQVVPVLALAEVWPGVPQLRLLGGGFTEGATLTVNVNGTPIADTGANLDVSSSFIANDRLHVSTAASAGQVVSVSTAGGTSAAVTIALDDPATVGAMYDLAIFPPTAGADAGRLVVADGSSTLKVLDPLTLAVVRTLTLPGAATTQLGVAFIGADVTVGGVLVPAGSLAVVNGADTPDRLYYLDPVSGAVLASVALGGPHPTDEAGGFALAYHAARGTLFVMRNNTDLITEINPASGAALRSFHTNFGVADYYAALTVHPVRGTLLAGNGARVFELDAASGEVVGSYDHIGNTQLGPVDVRQQGATFEDSQRYLTGLAFDGGGNLRASTYSSGRILDLTLPGAPTAIQVGAALAVAIDGTPADPALPSANAGQRILISGSGYNRFTEVEFERVTESGARGYLRVAADAVRADGSALEVVVPEEAVTGRVRISGAPGAGLRLQVTPTIRATLPADPSINFDVPVEGDRWGLFGSGLVEGATTVSFGGVLIEDNSASALVDVLDVSATGFFRDNGRLDLTIPERSLAGPVTVTTEGGTFTQPGVPIRSQAGVGLTGLVATAGQGTATNALAASANTGQTISLQGFGLTTGSLVSFQGVAEDGTRGLIVTRPVTAVPDGTSATVVVPVLAVSGPVTVAGAAGAFTLQIVPTLTGVSAGSLTPGAPLWLIGTGIPEGGAGGGEAVTYTVGGVAVSDIDGTLGPDVRSALGKALAVALNTPAGASGDTITVSTAGGSATLTLVNLSTGSLAAEPQGSGAADGVGGTLASATALNVGPNSSLTVTGRTNTAPDVDLYRLDGAEAGGILSVTAAGPQPGYSIVRIFNASGNPIASGNDTSVSRIVLPAGGPYYLGYSGYPNQSYNSVDGTGMQNGIFFPGDYTLALRYADPGTTSLDAIGTVAASGVPTEALVASANVGQAISVQGAGFTSATRVVFTTFSGYSPYSGPLEREVAPASVAPGGTSLTVVVPHDAVTGVVRLADERAGLLLQIVPTLGDIDLTSGVYSDTASLTLSGSGFVEGAQTLLLGNAIGAGGAAEVQDLWVGAGPDVYYSFVGGPFTDNSVTSLTVPIEPPTGPLKVRTLGGTSAPYELQFTGIAPGTVADRGTPANGLLASANVREAITLLGAGFDSGTEVIFAIQTSNDDQRGTRVLTPTSVAADGTSLTLIVPDDAVTGELRVMGAEGSHFLQIVPTIVQVLTPGTFATGQSMTVQGSGFIEGDVSIVLGGTVLFDTGAFFGPDIHNSFITFAGKDRTDNDGISLTIPPGSANGPWEVTTSGGTARFGIVVDLGVVVQETRAGRTVAPGEQELFKATAAVDGWLDFDVTFAANTADVVVLNQDGTPATLVEDTSAGGVSHKRVATVRNQVFFVQTNGISAVAAYDLVVTNQDRFDDPVGPQQGAFLGNYGLDPDGRNDTADAATAFTPASYVNETFRTLTPGEADWYTWTAQATGKMDVAALFAPANGQLGFRVYADTDGDGVLDPAEAAAPIATGAPAADGARVTGILADRGDRFWTETFGSAPATKNVYAMSFSNLDLVDAGLLAGYPIGNDVRANAVDLGLDVSWNSSIVTDALTIHQPNEQDWFRLTTGVSGTLRVLVDNEFPEVGQVNAQVVDVVTGANLTLMEFLDLGDRLQFTFAPVAANQALYVQFTGQPNSYTFSIQNNDRFEDNPSMAQPANRGPVVHDRQEGLSLPGLPDIGTRDEDWFKLATPAPDSRLDVTVTPVATFGGDVTVRIWRDADGDAVPETGELVSESTSVGGAAVTVQAAAVEGGELYAQIFDPLSGPLTGVVYHIDIANVDRFDKADPAGAANNVAANATDLGSVVHVVEPGLTLLPLDADWFTVTARGEDGTLDVLVTAQGDTVAVNVYRDSNADGSPDALVSAGTGRDIRLEGIAAARGERFWIETALVNPANLNAAGSLVRLEVRNADRFDDPVGDNVGGFVNNPPTGNDPDGLNNGPRTTGATVEGTLRLVQPNPAVPATMQGHIGVSTDGLGTFTTGNVQAEIPAGSTVELALLYVTTRSFSGPYRPAQIGFDGSTAGLQFLPNVDNAAGVDFETLRADVTSIVSARVGSAGGIFNFVVDETLANGGVSDQGLDSAVEGTALVVIFSNPTLPVRSVAVLEGGLSGPATQTTRLSLATPVLKTDPNFLAQLSLGISFGFQPDGQYSTVNVNGSRMTSSAGNFNDGSAANGTLITVGGFGDNLANPVGPFDTTDTSDDERYDLAPFLANGDREIVLETANPSDDDSIFLAVITVSGEASLGGILTDLGEVGSVTETALTLPAGDQDWFRIEAAEVGDMSVTLDFAPDGSATALMYRDANEDGLPDDLNGDSVPDSAGTVVVGANQLLISNIPASQIGDVFLLRVFNPTGQVEYDLDVRVNQHPEANPDAYSVDEDNTLTVPAAAGVLANDIDGDLDPLSATLLTGVSHGVLVFNAAGSFVYTPDANYFGPDGFTYSVADGFGGVDTASVTISVAATNDVPLAADDLYSVDEDATLIVAAPGVLGNDSDVDMATLTAALVTSTSNGSLAFNPDGSFTYTPNSNFFGSDSFTYRANDGSDDSNVATVTITVNALNDAPVAADDLYSIDEDGFLSVFAPGVLGNDTDVDSAGLTAILVSGTANGALALDPDGSISYIPNADFFGSDSFTYRANDGTLDSNLATVTINVAALNDAPVARDDSAVTNEDVAVTVAVLANDNDVDSLGLAITAFTAAANGTVAQNADGTFTYTPDLNFFGSDTFTYTLSDGQLEDTATVTITVNALNDAPVAADDLYSIDEDGFLSVFAPGVLGNDTDVDSAGLTAILVSGTANGALALDPDGSISYIPNADFFGSDSFTYRANDGTLDSNLATVTINVAALNDAPVARDDSAVTNEDVAVTVAVLANDNDVDSLGLAITAFTAAANGTVAQNADGTFTYTPDLNFFGSDTFTYTLSDGQLEDTATVTITVNALNDAPVAADDLYSIDEDGFLSVFAPGVLGNDTDVDSAGLTAILVSGTANGALALDPDGSISYIPNADFFGSDSFTYRANDGTLDSNLATVTINVAALNDAPVARDDSAVTNEDVAVTVAVLANDNDVDSLGLAITAFTAAANGTVAQNADGTFTYTPDLNFFGSDTFTYTLSDGQLEDTATVTITVNALNDAPVAADDLYSIDEDGFLSVFAPGVLGNDTDVDSAGLTAILVSGTANGALALDPDGSISYIPNADFFGSDSFTYRANDGTLDSNLATVTINVAALNDAPVARDDSAVTNEDVAVTVAVLANDNDVDSLGLAITAFTAAANGTVAQNADGTFTYTPDLNFFGSDTFTYTLSDGQLEDTATVTITVNALNDAPVAADDLYSIDEDGFLSVFAPGVLGNDTDVDSAGLTAILVSGTANGALALDPDGSISYIPNADFFGSDSFTYRANDGTLDSNLATVTINVAALNDAPVARDDSAVTNEDVAVTVAVLANDNDVDSLGLAITAFTAAANGTVAQNADGTFTYTPDLNFFGSDTFTYTLSDGQLEDTATVTITVNALNDAPVAADDLYSIDEDGFLSVFAPGVLGNDTDVDSAGLTAILVSGTANGALALDPDGSISYIPNADFFGSDSFTYRANDGTLDSNLATVTINVAALNDAPVARDDSAVTNEDVAVTVAVLANDNDVDSLGLAITAFTAAANGTVAQNADGTFTYTPDLNFFGSDTFTYTLSDGQLEDTATVTITVNALNDAPVAADDLYSIDEDGFLSVFAPGVLGNDTDVDSAGLTAILVSGTANGALALDPDGSISYIPNADFFGSDSFTYRANDGTLDSNLATVTINVAALNDAPVARDDSAVTNEDVAVTVAVLANDNDVDSLGLAITAFTAAANGTVAQNADGTFTYTPDLNFFGSDTFTYTLSDGQLEDTATVTITVNALNDAPVAADDLYSIDEDGFLSVFAPGVLGNDTDVDSAGLTAILVSGTANGALALDPDGSISYIPNADFFGSDSFTYRANDGTLDSNLATVTINVAALNDAPVARDDSAVTNEDVAVTVAVLANDNDVDSLGLAITAFTAAANGTVAQNADGTFTYTPDLNFFGSDTFTYTLSDGQLTDTATVTITINAVNSAPTALEDFYTVDEDTVLAVGTPGVLGNDTDAEGAALSALLVNGPDNGTLAFNADGSFIYTPELNFFGTDSFTYRASDGSEESGAATVTITVGAVNDAPVALDDGAVTDENVAVTVDVLANDSDVDSAMTVTAFTQGANGTVSLNADGTLTYAPNSGFVGSDSFEYDVSDGELDDTALVLVTVRDAGAPAAIDIEKYVKLAGGKHGHKGNEGVGNGEDPPPPGHDDNWNDGPGTGPGNPGMKGGGGHDRDDDDDDDDDHHHGGGKPHGDDSYGLDADTAPGLTARVGDKVTFTYVVTNVGTVALSNVRVVDDNETPDFAGDDFRPDSMLKSCFNVGDRDRDGLLDPGESWLYTWTTKVTEGQHVNVAMASGTLVGGGGMVSDADPAHWVGIDPHTASIGNFVWSDGDGDGVQDHGERGIRGVVVNLLDEDANVVATAVTDANGRYDFTGLAAGRYAVEVARSNFAPGGSLAGMAASPRDRGGNDGKDSDADPATLRSGPVVLSVGEKDSSIDFGFRSKAGSPKECKDDDRDDGRGGKGPDKHDERDCGDDKRKHGSRSPRWPTEWAQDCAINTPKGGHRGHDAGERRGPIDWWGKHSSRGWWD